MFNRIRARLRKWLDVPERTYPPYDYVTAACGYQDKGIFVFTRNGKIYILDTSSITSEPVLMRLMMEIPT